jgi:preprotein translocase subunit SecG
MTTLFTVLHVITAVLLIGIILIQIGRAGSLSGLLGSGGGDQLFSTPTGSSFLRKLTIGLAIFFVITSMCLTFISSRAGLRTVTGLIPPQAAAPAAQQPAPAAPAAAQPAGK